MNLVGLTEDWLKMPHTPNPLKGDLGESKKKGEARGFYCTRTLAVGTVELVRMALRET